MGHATADVFIPLDQAEKIKANLSRETSRFNRRGDRFGNALVNAAISEWVANDEGMNYGYSANPGPATIENPMGWATTMSARLCDKVSGDCSLVIPVYKKEDMVTFTKVAKLRLSGENIAALRSNHWSVKEKIISDLREQGHPAIGVEIVSLPAPRKPKVVPVQGKVETVYRFNAGERFGHPVYKTFKSRAEARTGAMAYMEAHPEITTLEITAVLQRVSEDSSSEAIVTLERPVAEGTVTVVWTGEKPKAKAPKIEGYLVLFDYHF